jgi:hypothetical protein
MPNKRSKRGTINYFYCPLCQSRLWRLGSKKNYLYYHDKQEIRQNTGLSAKKAAFLVNQSSTYLDNNCWLEEFFCVEHGKLWLKIMRQKDDKLTSQIAAREDWQKTGKTIDPDRINPSVSEYSYKMSRRTYYGKLTYSLQD